MQYAFFTNYLIQAVAQVISLFLGYRSVKEYFKILLTQTLDELLTEAKKTARGMTDFRDGFPDFIDEASLESDRNLAFRIRERESKLIRNRACIKETG